VALVLAAVGGLAGSSSGYGLRALGCRRVEYTKVGEVPLPTLLLLRGLVLGILFGLLLTPIVNWAARRARRRASQRLRPR